MAKSITEQLLGMLDDDPDTKAKIQAKLAANPKLIAEDAFTTELFGVYKGIETGESATTTTTPETAASTTAAATHTPTVPTTASASATTTVPAVAASTATGDNKAILDALNALKTSVDDRLKNVVTMDKVNELGTNLINQASTRALQQADEIYTIRDTHRREFNEDFNRADFEKFVTEAMDPATKRNKYATLTDAYNAMVSEKRIANRVKTEVDTQVKQKLSAATVPGQTTSVALSPAMQVLAKQRAAQKTQEGSSLERAIAELAKRDQGRDGATVQ